MKQDAAELALIYNRRFASTVAYRKKVWAVLVSQFFSKWVGREDAVLDLGCGYGEFINQVACRKKWAMDLNPQAAEHLLSEVTLIAQDCSEPWPLISGTLDVVFTSNFFEHLRSKDQLLLTLAQAFRCLKPGGRLIAMGPNIKFLPGRFRDFFDHHVALTELSLAEALEISGFDTIVQIPRFLPYTMVAARRYPLIFVSAYLRLKICWPWFGHQFLVVARKP
jgi:SAM-dependent methyltransferase